MSDLRNMGGMDEIAQEIVSHQKHLSQIQSVIGEQTKKTKKIKLQPSESCI